MKKTIFLLLILSTLHCGAVPGSNNGHHAGGGNSGNGNGNGGNLQQYQPELPGDYSDSPGEVPGDPDAGQTEVPLDNTEVLILLVSGAFIYGVIKNRKEAAI
jgi:hypothetical protein